MPTTITVRYFALLRDLTGKTQESLTIEAGDSAAKVFLRVAETYGLPLALTDIRIAVNDEFTSSDHPLQAHDQLVFIPPVAGG